MKVPSKHAFLAAGIALIAAALFAHSFDFGVSADSVSASWCSAGTVSAWVAQAAEGSQAHFSAETGYVNTVVHSPSSTISASGSASTEITFNIPECLVGAQYVTLTAQVCPASGGCETRSKSVLLNAVACSGSPAAACNSQNSNYNSYARNVQPGAIIAPSPVPLSQCGSTPCYNVLSTMVRGGSYYPAAYSASLERSASFRCLSRPCSGDQALAGEAIALQLWAKNKAAAGSFEVRAYSESPEVTVFPKSVSVDLSRGETQAIDFTARTSPSARPGSHIIVFRLFHNNVELASLAQAIEVTEGTAPSASGSARLVIPPAIVLSACQLPQQITAPAKLENDGGSQEFTVSAALRGQQVFSQPIFVNTREKKQFDVLIDARQLATGENTVQVSATSAGFEGSGVISILVLACGGPSAEERLDINGVFANESGNKIVVVASVSNEGSAALNNITGELLGLPEGWKQASETVSIAPRSERNLTIVVLATSSESVSPILAIKSSGKILSTRQLGAINKNSSGGLTGLFIAGVSDEALFATLIALMVIAAVFLFAAAQRNSQDTGTLKQRLTKARDPTTPVPG